MQINELFLRDIDRNINGVIKAGQQDRDNVFQELDEYVVTRELDGKFRQLFKHYAASLDSPTDKVGVWISGFFGSGKSHFLKILSYLFENREIENRKAVNFFDEVKLPDALLRADIERVARAAGNTDVILFNIDAKAEANSKTNKQAVASVMQKAFDEHLGYLASTPEMAAFERMLDQQGKYAEFKAAFESVAGQPWTEARRGWMFHQGDIASALQQVAGMSEQESQRWLESLSVTRDVSAEEFALGVREYLDRKGKEQRILFLVDEVGQYVGDNSSLMLNLQSVTEQLGTQAPGRAWILVTSQEDIDAVVAGKTRSNDFSKIQGRFHTRLNLSSANVGEVIRLRLLNKTDAASQALGALYDSVHASLKNLLTFRNDRNDATLEAYHNREDFVANYPFIPYQFKLLQEAFTAIRQTGFSGKHLSEGERSMLNAFQDAAIAVSQQPLGALVPFYVFYGAVEGFLDGNIRRVIDQAQENSALQAEDVQLLQTLFMLKHVKEIDTNLDNLVTLSLSHVDEDKLALRERVARSLERLERQVLIARNGDVWSFLTNEEQDISKEIRNVDVAESELTSELQKLIWESIYSQRALKYDAYHQYSFNRRVDERPYGQAPYDIGLHVLTPFAERFQELTEEHKAIAQSGAVLPGGSIEALAILPDDRLLFDELTEMIKTNKYIIWKSGRDSSPNMQNILSHRAAENSQRQVRVEANLRNAIAQANVYVLGSKLQASGQASEVLGSALKALVENGFPKRGLLKRPHQTEAELQRAFTFVETLQTTEQEDPNQSAQDEVENWLSGQNLRLLRVTIRDLLNVFTRRPYGWTETETLGILASLVAKGRVDLEQAQKLLDPGEPGLAGKLLKKAGQDNTVIRLSATLDPKALAIARRFAPEFIPGLSNAASMEPPRLASEYRRAVDDDLGQLKKWLEKAQSGYPFGQLLKGQQDLLDRLSATSGAPALLEMVTANEEPLEDWVELREKVSGFYEGKQVKIYDELRSDLRSLKPDEARIQDADMQGRLQKVRDMLAKDDPIDPRTFPQLSGSLKPVLAHVEELLERARQGVEQKLADKVAHLQEIAVELGPDITKTLTQPILDVREELQRARVLSEVDAAQLHLQQAAEQVERSIFEAINMRVETVTGPQPTDLPSGDDHFPNPAVVVPVKKIVVIEAKQAVTKTYLESHEDIEQFLSALRQQLEQAVQKGERVTIK